MQVSIKMAGIPDTRGVASPSGGGTAPNKNKSKRNRKKKKASNLHTLGHKAANNEGTTVDAPYNKDLQTKTHSNIATMTVTVERLGYSKAEVSTAVNKLREADEEVTFSSLIDMSSVVQQEFIRDEITKLHCSSGWEKEEPSYDDPDADLSEVACDTGDSEEDGDENAHIFDFKDELQRAIEKRKMELRAAIESLTFQCKVCRSSRATILLLPCGHLASCDDCLMDVRRCPIARCNKVVRGTKEVYFA